MSCPQNHFLVRLVGGELTGAEERDIRQHLDACPTCAQAFEGLRGTWDNLGAWNVDANDIDLTDRVLAQAMDQENPTHRPLLITVFSAGRLRLAASIAFAAGLGIATGVLVPGDRVSQGTQSSAVLAAGELAGALGLGEFATGSATGLPLGFKPEAPAGEEVEP